MLIKNFTIESSWDKVLEKEYASPYFLELLDYVQKERDLGKNIFPAKEKMFYALEKTAFEKVKVVIVGQDPYHGEGQAHGLCFSVPVGVQLPPSLKNICKELQNDLGCGFPSHGCLTKWAEQGVLLLNAILTVEEGRPLSHKNRGWERFTDAVIRALANRKEPIVFLLWGKNAQDKCKNVAELLSEKHHVVLQAAHPSPLSAYNGFFGCKHFSKTNEILQQLGKTPIDWQLDKAFQ